MATTRTILVSGGGISGLALACALRASAIDVEVVESKPALSDDGGVGLTLVGNALRALDGIGLARPIIDCGLAADHIRLCASDGTLLREQPTTGPWGAGIPGHCSISRKNLHGVLARTAIERGVRIRTGVHVVDSVVSPDGLDLTFSDGGQGRYLLCAAAEGLFSDARSRLFPGVKPSYSGQASWRALVRRPEGLGTSEIYLGGNYGVVGICPITPEDAYLYIVESAPEHHREDDNRLHITMRERLQGAYGGRIPALLDQLTHPSLVSYRPLPALIAPAPWYRGRTVLIGDAAHANPPVLAQGAAMGIEDAVVLAEELRNETGDIGLILERFMARRYNRAREVVDSSVQLARWEVEHAQNVDVPGVMTRVSRMLADPI